MSRFHPSGITPTERRAKFSERNGWHHAVFSPNGKLVYVENYKGDWKHDCKSGKGAYLSREGWLYEGDWELGRRNGYGVLSKVSVDGRIRRCYAGGWIGGKRNGFGCNWYPEGSYYQGHFCENKRHGYGRIWYRTGDYYQGTWKNDRRHGFGLLVQANGNRYEGEFSEGMKDGYGVFYHLVTGQAQRGFWEKGACLHSVVEDISWRQSASRATSYPIPKLPICHCEM